MKMKNWMIGLMMMTSMTAMAGDTGERGGNGGGAFVCKALDQSTMKEVIFSAVSQDIWEAGRKNSILTSELNETELSLEVLRKLERTGATRFAQEIRDALINVLKIRSIEEVKLVTAGDSKHFVEQALCEQGNSDFMAAAIYQDKTNDLVYSKMIFDKFDNVSKAALNVHEAIYKVLRQEYKDKDSVRTRKITGYLFSDMNLEDVEELIPFDSFNVNSTRSYKQKFSELKILLNRSTDFRALDFNNLDGSCFVLNRPGKFIPSDIEEQNLNVDIKVSRDKKNRVISVGNVYLNGMQEYPFVGITTVKMSGKQLLSESQPIGSGYKTFWSSIYEPKANPKIPLMQSIAYVNSQNDFKTKRFILKKTPGRDLIVAEIKEICEIGNYWRCKKYFDFNEIKSDPKAKIINLYYCPASR